MSDAEKKIEDLANDINSATPNKPEEVSQKIEAARDLIHEQYGQAQVPTQETQQ
jgi:hypothetical protein